MNDEGYVEAEMDPPSGAGRVGKELRARTAQALVDLVAARNHGDVEESLRRARAGRILEARIAAMTAAMGGDRSPVGRMMQAAVSTQNYHLSLVIRQCTQTEGRAERRRREAEALAEKIESLREQAQMIRGKAARLVALQTLVLYQDRLLRIRAEYTDALIKLGDLRREMWTVHQETASLVEEYALRAGCADNQGRRSETTYPSTPSAVIAPSPVNVMSAPAETQLGQGQSCRAANAESVKPEGQDPKVQRIERELDSYYATFERLANKNLEANQIRAIRQ